MDALDRFAAHPPLLLLERVSKSFLLYDNPKDRLKEALTGRRRHSVYQALADVSIQVRPGEAVGVLGRNGAGKSTLLKLVMGILLPDEGRIDRRGKITGLLELGTGFDAELSGRENIRINGRLLGMQEEELDSVIELIIEFSELGRFIDAPVRTYSSGMVMRLGFSVAMHSKPDCFVVDEALSVGDARFQQKCMVRIREYLDRGGSLLFVSHDLSAVKLICQRALVLHEGRVAFDGTTELAASHYLRLMAGMPRLDEHFRDASSRSFGSLQAARIADIQMRSRAGGAGLKFLSGERVRIQIDVEGGDTFSPTVGFLIRDRFGMDVYGTNTAHLKAPVFLVEGRRTPCIFSLQLRLAPGMYTLAVAVHSEDTHVHDCHHWIDQAIEFEVSAYGAQVFTGICELPVTFETHQPVALPVDGG